jgi:Plasmid pRiA4b ORF-3-like protein
MTVLRFRVFWEDDDQTYRDIEIMGSQTFLDFHKAIIQAYEFDGKHPASFYESNDKWIYGRELNSEVLVNKKDAPALSMVKTPVSALVSLPDQKFIYVYDPVKKWTFMVELIGVSKEETARRVYPFILRKEGVAPAQYGIKGVNPDKIMEIEEKYDLGAEEMAEGFGNEGEDGTESMSEDQAEEQSEDQSGGFE